MWQKPAIHLFYHKNSDFFPYYIFCRPNKLYVISFDVIIVNLHFPNVGVSTYFCLLVCLLFIQSGGGCLLARRGFPCCLGRFEGMQNKQELTLTCSVCGYTQPRSSTSFFEHLSTCHLNSSITWATINSIHEKSPRKREKNYPQFLNDHECLTFYEYTP